MSISFAAIDTTAVYVPPGAQTAVGGGSASVATGAYIPPGATGSASATPYTFGPNNGYNAASSYLEYFIFPYFDAHDLSWPSFRYIYVMWIVIGCLTVLWGIAHILLRGRGGSMSALWRKLTVRRFAIGWSKKMRSRTITPTIGQMLGMAVFSVFLFCLCYIGPDYLAPTTCLFGGTCEAKGAYSGPPKSSSRLARRQELVPAGWAPFNDPLLQSFNRQIDKSPWTSSSRIGIIAYGLLPLSVTLAVKLWPFAMYSIPAFTDYAYDKARSHLSSSLRAQAAVFHRWSGRCIWILTTAHVGLWTNQLLGDLDPWGKPVFYGSFKLYRFVAGWIAYGTLTLIVAFSFQPLRRRYYEFFFASHVVLVALTLAALIAHHRTTWEWPMVALAIWVGERATRFGIWTWQNGLFNGIWYGRPSTRALALVSRGTEKALPLPPPGEKHVVGPYNDSRGAFSAVTLNEWDDRDMEHSGHALYTPPLPLTAGRPGLIAPPGFALVQLLPGQMVRLVLRLPHTTRWRPGQHVLLTVPTVAWWQSHPYTIVGADPRALSRDSRSGSDLTFLIRARKGNGFASQLWRQMSAERMRLGDESSIYVRAQVSMPLGSCARTAWHSYKSIVLFVGGTGISFGAAILEHLCQRIAAREAGRKLGRHAFEPVRVRLVWILQEHVHLSWVAPILRRCMAMVSPGSLALDFFVTRPAKAISLPGMPCDDTLMPPAPRYAQKERRDSSDSLELSDSENYVTTPAFGRETPNVEESVLDYVLFEGDQDTPTAAEAEASQEVKATGRLRRALSRRKPAPAAANRYAQRPPRLESARNSDYGVEYPPHPSTQPRPSQRESYKSFGASSTDLDSITLADHSRAESRTDLLPSGRRRQTSADAFLDLTMAEREDLDAMAEFAREGRPRLDRIMDEEVNRATGKMMISVCGPLPLNVEVRRLVSERIKPFVGSKHRIDLMAEDFEN